MTHSPPRVILGITELLTGKCKKLDFSDYVHREVYTEETMPQWLREARIYTDEIIARGGVDNDEQFTFIPVAETIVEPIPKWAGAKRGKKDVRYLAELNGEQFYVTGNPCKWGHFAPRFTKNSQCTECLKAKLAKKNARY